MIRFLDRRGGQLMHKRTIVLARLLLLTIAACPVFSLCQSSNEWPVYGGSSNNWRYSVLTDINTSNVKQRLSLCWKRTFEGSGLMEATPIVRNGKMFIPVVHPSD